MARPGIRRSGNARALPGPLWESPFMRACRGLQAQYTPVWLMRQAGRYMPHYRSLRSAHSFLALCKDPALSAEVTIHARDWLGVDAAIIFSDILVVLEALGMPLAFSDGDGPSLSRPLRTLSDIEALTDPRAAAATLGYVNEAIGLSVRGLPAEVPLIGFCGAPFTLAAYAIEGGSSRQFARTRALMYNSEPIWHRLCGTLVETLIPYLAGQLAAGASCVQVFDSWVGQLTRSDFGEFVAPHLTRLVEGIPAGVPVILFGTGTGHLLDLIAACGADVIGVDSSTDLGAAWRLCGGPEAISVQGNLDPALLLAPRTRLLGAADAVIHSAGAAPGHIFNLGHGVLKQTDPEQARALVSHVHEQTKRR
jgi:uroporphyrinogen decarboxylase